MMRMLECEFARATVTYFGKMWDRASFIQQDQKPSLSKTFHLLPQRNNWCISLVCWGAVEMSELLCGCGTPQALLESKVKFVCLWKCSEALCVFQSAFLCIRILTSYTAQHATLQLILLLLSFIFNCIIIITSVIVIREETDAGLHSLWIHS